MQIVKLEETTSEDERICVSCILGQGLGCKGLIIWEFNEVFLRQGKVAKTILTKPCHIYWSWNWTLSSPHFPGQHIVPLFCWLTSLFCPLTTCPKNLPDSYAMWEILKGTLDSCLEEKETVRRERWLGKTNKFSNFSSMRELRYFCVFPRRNTDRNYWRTF